jgi:Tfp pilus assembly protein PilF
VRDPQRAPKRLKLFTLSTIGGFGVAVGIGLVMVFPYQSLERRLGDRRGGVQADRLTAEYLKVFLKAEPDNAALRISMAEQLSRLGAYADARALLASLYRRPDLQWHLEADWLALGILEQEADSLQRATDAPRRAQLDAAMRAQLRVLQRYTLTPERTLALGEKSFRVGDVEAGAVFLRHLADSGAKLSAPIYADAARTALGYGQYQTSARLSFRALEAAISPSAGRRYFFDGLRTLQSGGLLDEALAAADKYLDRFGDDEEILRFLTRLAQAANRPEAAERYVKRLLRLSHAPLPRYDTMQHWLASMTRPERTPATLRRVAATDESTQPLPFEEEAYALGYQVFLANRNLPAALRLAQSAVAQRPALAEWRKRLAEVSEWSGLPREALPQWIAYARMSGDAAGWDATLRLAQSLFDGSAQILALEQKLLLVSGNRRQLLDRLISVYEDQGRPERALQLVTEQLAKFRAGGRDPQRKLALDLYIDITTRMHRDAETLAALQLLQDEFGPNSSTAFRIASELYKIGKPEAALAALTRSLDVAPASDTEFWRAYAQIAAQLQDDPAAVRGYRTLLQSDAQSEADLSELFTLLLAKQPRSAARIAEFAYTRFGSIDFAVGALSAYAAASEYEVARRFLASLDPQRLAQLEANPSFLASRALLRQLADDLPGARRDLLAALALRPADADRG